MTKRIILCADDYGQNPDISQGILSLCGLHRLSAVSCMVNTRDWIQYGAELVPFKDDIDIGLHFNITEGSPLSLKASRFTSLSLTILRAYAGLLNVSRITSELHAQLDAFESVVGRLPDFVDGHQHVHQFPSVRHALLQVYETRLRQSGCYIRSVAATGGGMKRRIINSLGAGALKEELIKLHIPHNSSFSGVYDLRPTNQYAAIFPQFLKEIEEQGIIMCHPGKTEGGYPDRIAHARYQEFLYLAGEQFIADCEAHQVVLTRFLTSSFIE